MNQFREDEIRAIVNECAERRTYVSAHCHPISAIRRSVEFGVRCIEHATLIDAETAQWVAERGAYVVPTMSVIFVSMEVGRLSELFSQPGLVNLDRAKLGAIRRFLHDQIRLRKPGYVEAYARLSAIERSLSH